MTGQGGGVFGCAAHIKSARVRLSRVAGLVGWTWRWLTVGFEWQSRRLPTVDRIGYSADLVERGHDPTLIGRNRLGAIGPFHPVVQSSSTAEFERLGDRVRAGEVPAWRA